MPNVFMSYRRADSEVIAGRIYDHLEREFGAESIFKDVDDIDQGEDFVAAIHAGIQDSDVMLVIIGTHWLTITDETGARRIDNPTDFVRVEVTTGLERSKAAMLVIPLLISGASMPSANDLPDSLKPLAFANAAVIRNDPDFRRDMERVITRIKQHSVEEEAVRERERLAARVATRRILSIVTVITLILAVLATLLIANGTIRFPGQSTPTIDAVHEAFRLLTSTAEAEIAQLATPTPNFTATIEAILTIFPEQTKTADAATQIALAPTGTPSLTATPSSTEPPTEPPTATATPTPTTAPSLTPSLTPSDTPTTTANATRTLEAVQTQVFATVYAQATNESLATLRAPTNTPEPSDTPTTTASATQTPTATATESPTVTWTPTPSPSPPPTATSAPSTTFTATASPAATATATADATQIAAQQATALANAQATVAAQATEGANVTSGVVRESPNAANVRTGAGLEFTVIISIQPGARFEIIGSDATGQWLNVRLSDGTIGWIASFLAATITPEPDALVSAVAYDYRAGNAAWTPVAHTFEDGVTMLLVPPGCFQMGTSDEQAQYAINDLGIQPDRIEDEQPVHQQCFDAPFWIDQTEVTQADFERLGGQKFSINRFGGDRRPVEIIDWFEAHDFCELRGARLPTEREWEYAARGPDNLVYPWGNEWIENNAVGLNNSYEQTAIVGSYTAGASWVGALDMSGNVWEWVSDGLIIRTVQQMGANNTAMTGHMFACCGAARSAIQRSACALPIASGNSLPTASTALVSAVPALPECSEG